jgi:WD40 repeat protein
MLVPALLAAPGDGHAQNGLEPIRTPFPMIDAEMHVGPITGIATDPDGTLVVTGSTDKSIRLFDGQDGRFIQKYVLPLGDGLIGAITALALSPDSERILAATVSFDTSDRFDEGSLYLIDVASGETLGRIRQLPGAPTQIRFAPDGNRFAMAFGARGFELRSDKGKRLLQDIAQPVAALAISDSLLVTLSDRAVVRLFDLRGAKPQELEPIRIRDAGLPFSAALSPDGKNLAVGYADRGFVDVLDLDSRRKRRLTPSAASLTEGNLALVAWTDGDSPRLVAGGTVQTEGHENVIVSWDADLDGAPTPLAVSTDAITGLVPAGSEGIAYASADPSWGRIERAADGGLRLAAQRTGERLDFRELPSRGFAVSSDGQRVQFSDADPASPVLRFDLATLELEAGPAADPGLIEPDEAKLGKLLKEWRYRTAPKLGGRRLSLPPGERVLSANLASDGRSVVLGTDFRLRLYEASGQEIASRRLTSAAWAVAVVPDRPLVVAALGDGTIRWYSLRPDLPLAELASLFVTNGDRRWVAWTADSLFAHSDFGGQELVGYQQNGTAKAPTGTWLGLEQTYRLFHDPEAVSSVLVDEGRWSEILARERVDELFARLTLPDLVVQGWCALREMPKEVATRGLARPAASTTVVAEAGETCSTLRDGETPAGGIPLPAGTQAIRLRLLVEDQGGGLGVVDTIVDGRNLGRVDPAEASRAGDGKVRVERVIPLAGRAISVSFRAYDGAGVFTATSPIRFLAPAEPAADDGRQVLHVVSVGIDAYGGRVNPLRYAVADARTFAESLREVAPSTYDMVEPTVLYDQDATREGVVQALQELAGRVRPADAVMIYLAGHGVTDQNGRYVFVTSNVTSAEPSRLAEEGIDHETLLKLLSDLAASNVFVLLDTCYAGAFDLKGPADFANESGYFVLTASTSLQEALDSYDQKNGVFAFAVHQGLMGAAAAGEDEIDALQLGVFVRRTVPKLAAERNHRQSAVFKAAGGDFKEFPVAQGRRGD